MGTNSSAGCGHSFLAALMESLLPSAAHHAHCMLVVVEVETVLASLGRRHWQRAEPRAAVPATGLRLLQLR